MNTERPTTMTVDADQQPSMAVIDLVSRVEGVDALDLDPLYDAIDPDVLDSLCEPNSGFESLEFSYHDHSITVEDVDGDIELSLEDVAFVGGGTRDTDVVDTEPST